MVPETKMEVLLRLVRERGSLRPRDLKAWDIPAGYLDRLFRRGLVERVGHGVYVPLEADVNEHDRLAEAVRRVPAGIVCLLTALRFHGIVTHSPPEVWLALPPKAPTPRVDSPRLRLVRFSGVALTSMIEEHSIEGVTVRVYTPAKTVADCFKHRHKIGSEVAMEALRDCLWGQRATIDELWAAARVCRMTHLMWPYLEGLACVVDTSRIRSSNGS